MYDSILLPLDGSSFSEAAIPAATSLSGRTGADLRLLTVIEFFPTSAPYGWEDAAEDQAEEYLFGVMEGMEGRTGGAINTAISVGKVSSAILNEAESSDLVVMATHGRGGFSRAWLGGVADHLARHAKTPLLLIRPQEGDPKSGPGEGQDPGAGGDWTVSKILLPLDGSAVSEAIFEHALEVGALFGAAFHLVRVVPSPMQFISPYPPHMIEANRERLESEEETARTYLEGHVTRLRARGLHVDYTVLTGVQPAHGILGEAQTSGCDLIAISAHGRGTLARAVLGSTSDKVVRGTHLPVLLFRAKKSAA